ncbi:MAG: T9SS type A sorting domain-containing protein [Chitinophagaceae bacterium]|nr:T9SS type A sorting domain-containing protein [Chitinophagaceae bacterium]
MRPSGSLVLSNGKFYGRLSSTWSNETVVVFEWDPVTNVCIYKISFNGANTDVPQNGLTPFNEKFYGTTNGNDNNSAGGIFEWDPLTNDYLKKFDFVNATNERSPFGSLTFCAGKLYGFAEGGAVGDGVIFEWDPVTNEYAKKYDFNGRIDGWPQGNLAMNAGKLYGFTTNRNDSAVIFEWDPSSNIYTRKSNFILANTGIPSVTNLTLVPAPVAKGLPGSCTSFPTVTINNSNNNQWVSITDEDGNAVAEIKANGNNLGVVTTSMYINNAAVRQDAAKRLYLDRNITITPQFQPTTAVDIRLYIKAAEYMELKNAVNSIAQPSGINNINDINIYKVSSGCSPAVSTLTNKITATAGTWEADYVFTTSITSFSSFYFAGKAAVCSAPVITQVHANPATLWPPNHQLKNVTVNYNTTGTCTPITSWLTVSSNQPLTGTGCGDAAPDWIIVNNHHLKLRAERAGNGKGRIYTITINAKNAAGNISTKKTTVTVAHHQGCTNAKGTYNAEGYIDANGDYFDQWFDCSITPNPSRQSFNLQVATGSGEKIEASILDVSGRLIRKMNTVKNQSIRFGDELKPGVYMVIITQGQQQQIIKVIKQ